MKHEDIDHTGLTGVGGVAHAASHELGGSDEIDVTGLTGAGGGGGGTSIWEQIWELFDTNTDPRDALISSGAYRVFVHVGSHNANGWKAPTNATYTVPTGKKLIVIQSLGTVMTSDSGSRKVRLRNTTDSVDVLGEQSFYPGNGMTFPWTGDVATASKLPEVAAGKTVRLELFNSDTNKRAIGGLVICREV